MTVRFIYEKLPVDSIESTGTVGQFADIHDFVRWYAEFLHKQDCELQFPMDERNLDRITAILRKLQNR